MDINEIGKNAKNALAELIRSDTETKNRALQKAADEILSAAPEIIRANRKDMEAAVKSDMPLPMQDRLLLNEKRIEAMADGMRKIALLPDPVNELISEDRRPNGLLIRKVSVPIGVIGIIYESRPNVTSDVSALCLKAGNAVILRGGRDAIRSNTEIAEAIRRGISSQGLPKDLVQLITDTSRESAEALMHLNQYADCLIPRGSASLIQSVIKNSTVPVIETGAGNCHIFVDEAADPDKAIPIIINAKTQRTGVCNACESLVVDRKIEREFLPRLKEAFAEHHVEVRADSAARLIVPEWKEATEEDWGKEYLDLIISLKTVDGIDEAIRHINRYNTGHSESIITEDRNHAARFLNEIDAACVYVNASTRFTDGGEFGFGGEIGISTQKLHARGPMGLRELTSYKYEITGNGQVRS